MPNAEGIVCPDQLPRRSPMPDPPGGQLDLLPLLHEYAEHHSKAAAARKERRVLLGLSLVYVIAGSIGLLVCGILAIIDLAVGLSATQPPGSASGGLGMAVLCIGFFAVIMLPSWLGGSAVQRRKVEAAEAGMAGVLARLAAAFPQLDAGALATAVTGRPISR